MSSNPWTLPPQWQDQINFPLCLAPMVGLSHVALRLVIREYMPPGAKTWWPTEMLNSRRLPDQMVGQTPETVRRDDEDGLVPQILGNQEDYIARSVEKLRHWGAAGIDINMGCPVEKALRHNYGVALMGDPDYAAEVVAMTVRHAQVPVSVKLRAGSQGDFDFLQGFVGGLAAAGASWVTLHPRTPEQRRRGHADWSQIEKLKAVSSIPIIGNGDIQVTEDVFAMRERTGCDMVMAGRALAARPWMVWQLGEERGLQAPLGREGERAPRTPVEEGREYGRMIFRWIAHARLYFAEDLAIRKLRFFVRNTSPWLIYGHTLESLSTKGKSLDEIEALFREFFSLEQEMVARTDLRQ